MAAIDSHLNSGTKREKRSVLNAFPALYLRQRMHTFGKSAQSDFPQHGASVSFRDDQQI